MNSINPIQCYSNDILKYNTLIDLYNLDNKICRKIEKFFTEKEYANDNGIIDSLKKINEEIFKISDKKTYDDNDNNILKKLHKKLNRINKNVNDMLSPKEIVNDLVSSQTKKIVNVSKINKNINKSVTNINTRPSPKIIINVYQIRLGNKYVSLHPSVNRALKKKKSCVHYIKLRNCWYYYYNDFQLAIIPTPNQEVPEFYVNKIEYPHCLGIFEHPAFENLRNLQWYSDPTIKIGKFTFYLLLTNTEKKLIIREIILFSKIFK